MMQQLESHCQYINHEQNQIAYCCISISCRQRKVFCEMCKPLHKECHQNKKVLNEQDLQVAIDHRIQQIKNFDLQLSLIVSEYESLKNNINMIIDEIKQCQHQVFKNNRADIKKIESLILSQKPLLQSQQNNKIFKLLQTSQYDQQFWNFQQISEQRFYRRREKIIRKLRQTKSQFTNLFDKYQENCRDIQYADVQEINKRDYIQKTVYEKTHKITNFMQARFQKDLVMTCDAYGEIMIYSIDLNKVTYKVQSPQTRFTSFEFLNQYQLYSGDKKGKIHQMTNQDNELPFIPLINSGFQDQILQLQYLFENYLIAQSSSEIGIINISEMYVVKKIKFNTINNYHFVINYVQGILITPYQKYLQIYKFGNLKLIFQQDFQLIQEKKTFLAIDQDTINCYIIIHQFQSDKIKLFQLDYTYKKFNLIKQIEGMKKVQNISITNEIIISETNEGISFILLNFNQPLVKFIQSKNDKQEKLQVQNQTHYKRIFRIQDNKVLMFELQLQQ